LRLYLSALISFSFSFLAAFILLKNVLRLHIPGA